MFPILLLLTSLSIAGVAAWFSIEGIVAIFSGLPMHAAIMGGVLEAGKLVTASFLYRYWESTKAKLKWSLVFLTVVLMLITSMGIFGLLSKAHLQQDGSVSLDVAKIERIDQKIALQQKIIDDNNKVVAQLDAAVDKLLQYDRIRGKDGSIAIRQSQKEERKQLADETEQAQQQIDKLQEERVESSQKVKAFEREVGPVKYIADLVFDNPETMLDSAVRMVILLFVFVFDPLAVLLLIAANQVLVSSKKEPKKDEPVLPESLPGDLTTTVPAPNAAAPAVPSIETKTILTSAPVIVTDDNSLVTKNPAPDAAPPAGPLETKTFSIPPNATLRVVNNKVYPVDKSKIKDEIKPDEGYSPNGWLRKLIDRNK